MVFSVSTKFISAVVFATSLASAAPAENTALQKQLPSAFAGLGWSIGGVPLGVDFVTAVQAADPSVRLKTHKWVAKRTSIREPDIAPHDEYRFVNFGVTDIRALTDRKIVNATHWHTGSMAWKVERKVTSNKPDLMPTADALVAAVMEAFGNAPAADRNVTGRGGVTQRSRNRLSYAIKNGTYHDGPCYEVGLSYAPRNSPRSVEYEGAKAIIAQIKSGNFCEGVLTVTYADGQLGRLREFHIVAQDFLMEAENFVHNIDVKRQLVQEHENNLPSVEPKL